MCEYENGCVGCPPELGCIGNACPYKNIPRYYCDVCDEDGAKYRIDDVDFCENCADKYLKDVFDDFTITEKANMLKVNISVIDNE